LDDKDTILVRRDVYTFENPGSKPNVVDKLKDKGKSDQEIKELLETYKENALSFVADVNIVNTWSEQLGKVIRIKLPYNYYTPLAPMPIPKDIQPIVWLNPYYLVGYSLLDQHNMRHIYDYVKKDDAKFIKLGSYPHGFVKGFASYLDYDARKDYWLRYFVLECKSQIKV
jgi:hypothetical protein